MDTAIYVTGRLQMTTHICVFSGVQEWQSLYDETDPRRIEHAVRRYNWTIACTGEIAIRVGRISCIFSRLLLGGGRSIICESCPRDSIKSRRRRDELGLGNKSIERVSRGRLPSPAPGRWTVLVSSDGVGCGVLRSLEVETTVLWLDSDSRQEVDDTSILRSVEDDDVRRNLDGRVLTIRESDLEGRHLSFQEAVSELSTQTGKNCRSLVPERLDEYASSFGIRTLHNDRDIYVEGRGWTQRVGPSGYGSRVLRTTAAECRDVWSDQYERVYWHAADCRKIQKTENRHRQRTQSEARHDDLQETYMNMGTRKTREYWWLLQQCWTTLPRNSIAKPTILKSVVKCVRRDRCLVVTARDTCLRVHFRVRLTSKRLRSRSSSPSRASQQTRILDVRTSRAPLDIVSTSHDDPKGSPKFPLGRFQWSHRRDSDRRQQKHVQSWVSEALGALNWWNGTAAWFDHRKAYLLVFATSGRRCIH